MLVVLDPERILGITGREAGTGYTMDATPRAHIPIKGAVRQSTYRHVFWGKTGGKPRGHGGEQARLHRDRTGHPLHRHAAQLSFVFADYLGSAEM